MACLTALTATLLLASGSETPPPTSIQDAPAPTFPQWNGSLTFGAIWTAGNTEASSVSGSFNTVRRGEKDRWTLDLFTNYGETQKSDNDPTTKHKTVTTNNSGGGLKYDYFASKKLYLFANGTGKVDHVADLDLRYIVGLGAGYQVKETEKVKWGTEIGASYVDEDLGDDTADANFVALRLGSNLAWQISKTSAFEQVAEILPSIEDSEDVIAKVDNRLKTNLGGKWIAQLQYVLEWDDSVPAGNTESDHRVVASIGWSFGS